MVRRMADVHQMDYEASVAPADEMEDVLSDLTSNDSEPSLTGNNDRYAVYYMYHLSRPATGLLHAVMGRPA